MLGHYERAPRLIQDFKEFLDITDKAAVTIQQLKGATRNKIIGELRFNLFDSPEKYEKSLRSLFSEIVKELEAAIAERFYKIEKLNLISNHIVEVESLFELFDSREGMIHHANYGFVNLTQALTKKKIKLSIEIWLSKLSYLKTALSKGRLFKKYENLTRPIEGLILFLYEKYPTFCPKPDSFAAKLLAKPDNYNLPIATQLALPKTNNPGVFQWQGKDPTRLSLLLHEKLNKRFIKEINLEQFHVVFSGGLPEKVPSITWIDKTPNDKHTSKVTLLYLFRKLSDAKLIDVSFNSQEMLKKLSFIFRDHEGNTLENFIQSKKNLDDGKKGQTSVKRELDEIVKLLLS
jgi:hypothetical protein